MKGMRQAREFLSLEHNSILSLELNLSEYIFFTNLLHCHSLPIVLLLLCKGHAEDLFLPIVSYSVIIVHSQIFLTLFFERCVLALGSRW